MIEIPDIWTRYPDVVREILQQAGFRCGIEQKRILVNCVTERFCSFTSSDMYGEICIHDLPQTISDTMFLILAFVVAVVIIAVCVAILKKKLKKNRRK